MSRWFDGWAHDGRFALRSLRRSPGFAVAAIATLALGLGANAAVFSFLDQLFLQRPAGVASPEQLRRVWTRQPDGLTKGTYVSDQLSYHQYRSIASSIADQAQLALYSLRPKLQVGRGNSQQTAAVAYATSSYFQVVGVHAEIGRFFSDGEADVHSAEPVVVLSDAFWRRYFGGDSKAIGQALNVDGHDYTVIGIASAGFRGLDLQRTELWLPLGTFPTRETARVSFWDSSVITFSVIGRLGPDANEATTETRATNAYRNAPVTDFAPSQSAQIVLRSIIEARGLQSRPLEVSIAIRLAFVAVIILLITTANVVNLMLARATARRRECAVRVALGISRMRLARLFVIESAMLAFAAAIAALFSAAVTGGVLRSIMLPGIQFARGPVNADVVWATLALSLMTGIVAGLVPALRLVRSDLTVSLKDGARSGSGTTLRMPSFLVGAQVALSVMLLVSAGLFVTSLRNVQNLRVGFAVPRLVFASVVLPAGERADTLSFAVQMREAGDRVRRLRGVEAVAFAREEPMTGFGRVSVYAAGDSSESGDRPLPTASYVSASFFEAAGLALLQGAVFTDDVATSGASIVVNRALARAFWPSRDPTGQCVHLQQRESPCLIVAGVVEDAIRERLTEEPAPQLYLPLFASVRGQRPPTVMIVRGDPPRLSGVVAQVVGILRDVFPRGESQAVRMEDRLAPQYRPWRLGATLFSTFGVLAVVVAALGVFSSVSYIVTQRVRELGIRIALGATNTDVLQHVLARGVRPVLAGGVIGAGLAVASGQFIAALLYGVSGTSAPVILGAVVTLLAIGAAAAAIPALRATAVDPVQVMTRE